MKTKRKLHIRQPRLGHGQLILYVPQSRAERATFNVRKKKKAQRNDSPKFLHLQVTITFTCRQQNRPDLSVQDYTWCFQYFWENYEVSKTDISVYYINPLDHMTMYIFQELQ